jgi:hypothetical protein
MRPHSGYGSNACNRRGRWRRRNRKLKPGGKGTILELDTELKYDKAHPLAMVGTGEKRASSRMTKDDRTRE